jgi:L-rhamnose mutarotase
MADIRRFGKVIGIKEEEIEEYKRLHSDTNPGVRSFIAQAFISNFSIYIQKLDNGKYYLFSYFEYLGDNYESDMAQLGQLPEIKTWLTITDPMQIPFPGESTWKEMEQIYFNK